MSIRILVVDDNPDILANVRDFLSMKDGWAPETASTGLEALERIDRSTFDLVILDVGLPDTDGMTLIHTHPGLGWSVADLPDFVS